MQRCSQETADGVFLAVKLQPGARRNQLLGVLPDPAGCRLRIAVTAPPEAGRANAAACALLAAALGLAERNVRVAQGQTSRQKRMHIQGDPKILMERLAAL